MRIAQVAPLTESVPPKLYGGTERIVSYLTEELVRQGHDVTLFASGDSTTSRRIARGRSDGAAPECVDQRSLALPRLQLEEVRRRADEFDVIHFHSDFCTCRWCGRWDSATCSPPCMAVSICRTIRRCSRHSSDVPLVSISDQQRAAAPRMQLGWHGASRAAAECLPFQSAAARRLRGVPGTYLTREARRPRYRDSAPGRACASGSPPKSMPPIGTISAD